MRSLIAVKVRFQRGLYENWEDGVGIGNHTNAPLLIVDMNSNVVHNVWEIDLRHEEGVAYFHSFKEGKSVDELTNLDLEAIKL